MNNLEQANLLEDLNDVIDEIRIRIMELEDRESSSKELRINQYKLMVFCIENWRKMILSGAMDMESARNQIDRARDRLDK